jgi:hypothetical protein
VLKGVKAKDIYSYIKFNVINVCVQNQQNVECCQERSHF